MSGKAGPEVGSGEHGPALTEGVGTALSWLTVIPVRGATTFDRVTGRRAIASIPVAGLVPGLAAVVIIGGIAWFMPEAGDLGFLVAGVLTVASGLALTRAMHVDGLADVTDALGSYGPPEKARAVLADPAAGPMAVAVVGLTLLTQVSGFALMGVGVAKHMLPDAYLLVPLLPAVLARTASMTVCTTRWKPFSGSGFGSLVAGTQPAWSITVWWLVVAAVSFGIVGWAGLLACAAALAVGLWLGRLCNRRFGGINGDVLGAVVEFSTAATAVILGFALVLG